MRVYRCILQGIFWVAVAALLATAGPAAARPALQTGASGLTIEKHLLSGELQVGGDPALFSIRVTNAGPSDATNVQVQDILDPALDLLSLVPGPGQAAVCAADACTVATLPAGETVELYARVQARADTAPGSYTNQACLLQPVVLFSAGPGAGAPPATLGPYTMTPFPADTQPLSTNVSSVAGPTGDLGFSPALSHYRIGQGWGTWSHGYTGDVYLPRTATQVVLTLPPDTGAFYLYVEPDFGLLTITATAQDGATSGPVQVNGASGARYFGFYSLSRAPLTSITVSAANAFAVGEFGIAPAAFHPGGVPSLCASAALDVEAQADVWLELSGPAGAVPGAAWSYTVTAHNNGPAPAGSLQASVSLPAGLSTTGPLAWPLPSLAPGASQTWTVQAELDSSTCPGGPFRLQAAITAATLDPDLSNNTQGWTTALQPAAALRVAKALTYPAGGPAIAGQVADFTLTIQNTGPGCAQDVVVMEDLGFAGNPPGLVVERYTSLSTQAVGAPPDGVWYTCSRAGDCRRAAPLPPGASDTLALTVRLPAGTPAGAYQNRAALTWAGAGLAATALADYTVQAQANLSVSVFDLSDPVQSGQGLVYQVTAANHGPSDAPGVVVTDVLNAHLAFAAASPGCTYQAAGHQVVCALGTLPAGATATLLVAGTVGSVPGGTSLDNQAAIAGLAIDPLGDDNQAGATTTVQQEAALGADLSIEKTARVAAATAGDQVTYQIVVRNAGPLAASGVEMQDLLPQGAHLVSLAADNPDAATEYCNQGGGCYLGGLAVGRQVTITLVARLDEALPAGMLVNQALVRAIQVDDDPADNLAAAGIQVAPLPRVDLALVKRAAATVTAGQPLDYTLEVWNHAGAPVEGVVVSDTLPAQVSFVGASPACRYVVASHSLACRLDHLAAGASAALTVTARVNNAVQVGASVENNAVVSVPGAIDLHPADNSDSADTSVVGLVDLALSLSGPVSANAGQELLYTILVTNTGPSIARSVDIRDLLPAGLELLQATARLADHAPLPCSAAICQVGDMAPGQVAQVTLRVRVEATLPAQVHLTNQAVVFCYSLESTLLNNTASRDLLVLREMRYLYLPSVLNWLVPPP